MRVVVSRATFPVVVHVLLIKKQRLFLLRRSNTGFMDGFYGLPGGHQDIGESVSEAAARECLEETGIDTARVVPVCVMPYQSGRHQGLNFVFEAEGWEGDPRIAEPALFDDCCWSTFDRLPDPHAPWIGEALALRRDGRWYAEFKWD
ncbi:MAG: NUDIX domain-containing protein [Gammaproteobacteria bacterium]|nr:NUDIX domain-containing protein [Gammaproteobacteria bacterium]